MLSENTQKEIISLTIPPSKIKNPASFPLQTSFRLIIGLAAVFTHTPAKRLAEISLSSYTPWAPSCKKRPTLLHSEILQRASLGELPVPWTWTAAAAVKKKQIILLLKTHNTSNISLWYCLNSSKSTWYDCVTRIKKT